MLCCDVAKGVSKPFDKHFNVKNEDKIRIYCFPLSQRQILFMSFSFHIIKTAHYFSRTDHIEQVFFPPFLLQSHHIKYSLDLTHSINLQTNSP